MQGFYIERRTLGTVRRISQVQGGSGPWTFIPKKQAKMTPDLARGGAWLFLSP